MAGRPRGAAGAQIVGKIRLKIATALEILDKQKTPIEELIAAQFKEDAAGTLQKLGRYMPQEVDAHHTGDLTIVTKQYVISREADRASTQLGSEAVPAPSVERTH